MDAVCFSRRQGWEGWLEPKGKYYLANNRYCLEREELKSREILLFAMASCRVASRVSLLGTTTDHDQTAPGYLCHVSTSKLEILIAYICLDACICSSSLAR